MRSVLRPWKRAYLRRLGAPVYVVDASAVAVGFAPPDYRLAFANREFRVFIVDLARRREAIGAPPP